MVSYISANTLCCDSCMPWADFCSNSFSFPIVPIKKSLCHGGSNSLGWARLSQWGVWFGTCHLNYVDNLKNILVRGEKKISNNLCICPICIVHCLFFFSVILPLNGSCLIIIVSFGFTEHCVEFLTQC